MNIEQWLENFRKAWSAHDIPAVMDLFTDDVEYWETPHLRIGSKEELVQEWQGVLQQHNIQLQTTVYSSTADGKNTVMWQLSYERDGETRRSGGTYLVTLNGEGKCNFFHYVNAPKPNAD